jgi:hypothetical protein
MPHTLLSAAVIIASVLAPRAVSASGASEVAVRIDESGTVVVPMTIDGRGPFPVILDTGSTHSVVSGRLAERLGLRLVARTSVLTSTGREWRPVVELLQTAIGLARSERILASVVPSAELDRLADGIEGIIGQDFLLPFNYTLDYRGKRLRWDDAGADHEGIRLALRLQQGRYVVRVTPANEKTPLSLVPDSGANGFVLFARNGRVPMPLDAAGPHSLSRGSAARTAVDSLSGRQQVQMMTMPTLRLGTATLRNQPVAVLERSSGDADEGDGLLPLHLFASVTFNASEGYLILRF